jgi:NAD(P)-dependent dehydrogenase (short-subunit alcohol dehydrogenase family)
METTKPVMFITGADKGLGLCLARKFLAEGFRVLAGQYGDGTMLERLAVEHPGDLVPVPQDVSDLASVRRSAEFVAACTPSLDILVNCAGVCFGDVHGKIAALDLSNGNTEKTMNVNAFGPLRVIQAFLPLVERGQLKKIVNISSEAGSIGANWRDYGYAYCMSKTAFNMLSQILQFELKPKGIKVLIFHPGWMRTDMGGQTAHIAPEEAADGIFRLTMKPWALDDPMYMDYTGKLFPW